MNEGIAFVWNEKKLKTKATKELISIKNMMDAPQAFMQDGPMLTYAVCEGLAAVMDLEEAKAKVGKMLGGSTPDPTPTPTKGVGVETKTSESDLVTRTIPIEKKLTVEQQLKKLQNAVELKKVLKGLTTQTADLFKYSANTSDVVKHVIEVRVNNVLKEMIGEIDA